MASVTPYKREQLPFIHRTWKTALHALDRVSPYGRKPTTANGDHSINGDEEHHRGVKRRRLDDDSLESSLGINGGFGHLPGNFDEFEKVFRIEVLKIVQNGTPTFQAETLLNGAKSPAKKDSPNIRVRCRLTIYLYKDRGYREYRALYSDNQICTIKIVQGGNGATPMARIYLASPFHIPAEKIYVERDDDKGFGLDDCYMIGVELESAGDPRWPPAELLPRPHVEDGSQEDISDRRRHWALSTRYLYRFDKYRWTSPVKLRKRPGEDIPTDFRMDTDLRWSTSPAVVSKVRAGQNDFQPSIEPMDGSLEPLTNGHVNGKVETLTNGRVKDTPDIAMDDDEEPEEATTPSRALRHRENKTYNLKLLSDKARGKEKKERKRRKAAEAETKSGQVIWILPSTRRLVLDNYACLRCFAEHPSMSLLKEHLECHTDYKHSYPTGGNTVTISAPGEPTPRISKFRSSDIQDMDEQESDVEEPEISPVKPRRSYSRSKTSQVSLNMFVLVRDSRLPIVIQQPTVPPKPRDTKQLVPNNKQPIYDPLSKQRLEPGSRVDTPQADMEWLLHKHRDIIRDYSDLHPDEKEFITEWDALVIRISVTTEPHLQEVYLEFVQNKAAWMLARQSRMTEFAKHLSYLAARNTLEEETISKALAILREARSQKRADHPEPPKTPSPKMESRRSASGCAVCGQPVRGPATLLCSNTVSSLANVAPEDSPLTRRKKCSHRLYHDDCIREDALMPVKRHNWRCNECYPTESK